MPKTIVITGASSGFGAAAARHLADAGHTVYASMRGATGKNSQAAADAAAYADEHGVDLRTVEMDADYEALYPDLMTQVSAKLLEMAPADADPVEVARQIVRVVGLPKGRRPFRVHIDPAQDGAEAVNALGDQTRRDFYTRIGLSDLLAPALTTPAPIS